MKALRIRFKKLSDDRHTLEIVRPDGGSEAVECETRSYLRHDLLHYAVESEAGLESGFWGMLASGITLARMNDRKAPPVSAGVRESEELAAIEQIVGALHGTKARPAPEIMASLDRYAAALGSALPSWVRVDLVERAAEAMRRLEGRWRATPYGGVMELGWPK